MARVLLGVSGGIAAYKAIELARLATKGGHSVRVIQTPTSLEFVGRASFEGITGAPVMVDEFERDPLRGTFPGEQLPGHDPISHLELVRRCDCFCIAPASANTIAKLAHGQADNLLTSAYLACTSPVLVAPAMNNNMYAHPATQANIGVLKERGVNVVEPGTGALASKGEWGIGRLAEPAEILAAIEVVGAIGVPRSLDGLRVLVTAGGTREPLDAVRYIGNRSSGRMGLALAEEAARRGAEVTVVAANVTLPRVSGVRYVDVETADELQRVTLERFEASDVLLMAAAVADFQPSVPETGKITKEERERLTIDLVRTSDVLAAVASKRRPGQLVVGFAAEHGQHGIERARAKLERKQLDAIVFNDVSQEGIGFDAEENEVTLVTDFRETVITKRGKDEVAAALIDEVQELRRLARKTHGTRAAEGR
jgi:phosphopantothenoylcysteine decarboxylase/phosphopantothenate--cysteine ligase